MKQAAPPTPIAPAAGNRAKVFVSYSRTDTAFAQMLVGALSERGFDAFLDKTDIAPGEPWKERLAGLIAIADTVVFAASPDSIASPICAWELRKYEARKAAHPGRGAPLRDRRCPIGARPTKLGVPCRGRRKGRRTGNAQYRATDRPFLGARAYPSR